MKALFIARSTLYESPGGDTVQVLKTAEELRKLGVSVDVGLTTEVFDYTKYDIVHFFNIIRPSDILYHFKKAKVTAISTIFVDYTESEIKAGSPLRALMTKVLGGDFLEYLKAVAKAVLGKEKLRSKDYIFRGQYNSMKYLYKHTGALLPNSNSELNRLRQKFGDTDAIQMKVVNAIDPVEGVSPDEKYRNAIICVGRIERRKNQLNLVKAVKGLDIPCYIIGKPAINDYKYYELCKQEAGSNVFFVDSLPQRDIYAIMKAARVHVLPSWFETTGLVSLEAAYYGCNIVVSEKGDQKEYFQHYASYCEPDSVESIQKAILEAYAKPFNEEFKTIIKEHYTWAETAKQTKACYEQLLNR